MNICVVIQTTNLSSGGAGKHVFVVRSYKIRPLVKRGQKASNDCENVLK